MNHPLVIGGPLAFCLCIPLACSGGSRDDQPPFAGRFQLEATEPLDGGRLFLNDPLAFDFSTPVALASASLTTVSFAVFDANGSPLSEQPVGRFELAKRPGDEAVGRRLLFIPKLGDSDRFDDGGFRPGRLYVVSLVGGDRHNDSVLRDGIGQGVAEPRTMRYRTADGSSPRQLFRDRTAGGPAVEAVTITPPPGADGVALGRLGQTPIEIRLDFNQSLLPDRDKLQLDLAADPLLRPGAGSGAVHLRYDDPEFGPRTWIPATVELDNEVDRATLRLRPIGVLPNNAVIEVVVRSDVEDLSGESNDANAAYRPVVARFRTRSAFAPQFDAVVERFLDRAELDLDAPVMEPLAEVGRGFLRAGFDFEGRPTQLDYVPSDPDTRIDTDFATLRPQNGPEFSVAGGVLNLRNVLIPENVTVRGTGTRPLVFLVSGEFRVDGVLQVNGGDGQRVNGLISANLPVGGGVGVCGGGNGGRGSPRTNDRSFTGQPGAGPGQVPGGGGAGGAIACIGCTAPNLRRGAGGGGGSFATQGDPWYKIARAGAGFEQRDGRGGNGCDGPSGATTRTLAGAAAGPRPFTDARSDNDFWGVGVDRSRQIRIRGELAAPLGGGGGGGGGDRGADCQAGVPTFITDSRGGAGGAGGGVLIVKALGRIIVGPRGLIQANGGDGGGGEQAGSSNEGGGGGGGAGGMVVLMSAVGIDIHVKGSTLGTQRRFTYGEDEFTFSISADGGFGARGQFGGTAIPSKYPGAVGAIPADFGRLIDAQPLGGFGGLGVVQLMAPPGDVRNGNTDGTNTVLDDNIRVFADNVLQTGADKQRMLGWRGFVVSAEDMHDDFGNAVTIGDAEGDIRPAPILLPVPFAPQTRMRSRWIDLGSVRRRPEAAPVGARSLQDATGALAGPRFEFAGLVPVAGDADVDGTPQFDVDGDRAFVRYPAVLPAPAAVLSASTGAEVSGAPAHRIVLSAPALGAEPDRFAHYDADLLDARGGLLASLRILQHGDRELLLAAADGALPAGIAAVQVRARFFAIRTDGNDGLGPTYRAAGFAPGDPSQRLPMANVRIGFAFHQDPTDTSGTAQRYPAGDDFLYDLGSAAVQEQLRQLGVGYVQWDVRFDTHWEPTAGHPRPFGPTSPRPELRFLRLPFRF